MSFVIFQRQLKRVALWLALGSSGFGSSLAMAEEAIPVIDLHVDLSYQVNYKHRRPERATGQLVASRLIESGVLGVVLPLYVPHEIAPKGPRMVDLESSYQTMRSALQRTLPYASPGSPRRPDRVATWFAMEGAAPFAGRPEEVRKWVERGARIWGLVHVHDNALATSAGSGPKRLSHAVGLTEAGHALVRAIHAQGGIVDVSHASDRAVADILEHAREDGCPVMATHSNADRLAPHARNLTDDQLRAIAATGGVVGVNFHEKFLARGRRATLDDVVEQIRYLVDRIGFDHVALGSDYEGGIRPPEELSDVRGYQTLARALKRAGFNETAVRRIFSENVLRLLAEPVTKGGS